MSNLGQQRLTASYNGIGGEAWSLKPQRSRSDQNPNSNISTLAMKRRNYGLRFASLTGPFLPANANVIVRHR
ncbi:hypothetical protein HBH47_017120 [Parastagonospora nodorum]|nr:hypothetical protein HBH47_017120 [Parastagonospora nodorum]